jgi:hypothetical protein
LHSRAKTYWVFVSASEMPIFFDFRVVRESALPQPQEQQQEVLLSVAVLALFLTIFASFSFIFQLTIFH